MHTDFVVLVANAFKETVDVNMGFHRTTAKPF